MWETLNQGGVWLLTLSLFAMGLLGCVLPFLPGHLLIFTGAVCYRIMLGSEAGVEWWGFAILLLLMAISQFFEIISGSLGSKWFGGSRWGAIGALIGGLAGLFFLPFGLVIGPLIGAFGCEILFAKRSTKESAASGLGSVVGTLSGLVCNLIVGALMIAWFFVDVLWIG
jgi:uncharacterized protein YqgC (DUF456 family)